MGKRGAIIVPTRFGKRFGIEEGSIVLAEEREDGILIRPAVVVPVERYGPERKAEFHLSNATTEADYRRARSALCKLGLNPIQSRTTVSHRCTACSSTPTCSSPRRTTPTQDSFTAGN